MNYNFKKILFGFLTTSVLLLNSCRKDDDNTETVTGNGNLTLKFENGFGNLGGIVLNTTTQTSTNGQKHQFSTLKYIISNVVLTKDDGTEVKYNYNNPDKGAFIIDQADAVGGVNTISLSDIPAGNYSNIKIGLGVSQEAYILGQTGQANFWTTAQAKGLTWNWAAGYIFVKLEGKYGNTIPETEFMNHIGNKGNISINGTANVYSEITLKLPTSAKVRTTITPAIHFLVDFNKYLSGKTAITLSSENDGLMGSSSGLVAVADNLAEAFSVEHVHND